MDTRQTLLQFSERFESLVGKLPAALQKPILQELVPLKDLFLRQRAPRIVLCGDPQAGSASLFNAIFTAPVAPFAEGPVAAEGIPAAGGWQDYSHQGNGVLRLLDTRVGPAGGALADATTVALAAEAPDLYLFLRDLGTAPKSAGEAEELDRLERLLELALAHHPTRACVVGVVVHAAESAAPLAALETARLGLQAALAARPRIAQRLAPAVDVATFMRFRLDGSFDPESDRRHHIPELVQVLVSELPNEARLEMARLSGAREAQAKIAQTLIKSVSAVSGALGAQPIPLADLPFLLTFQVAMVAGIIYISGRELSLKLATEFMGTLGVNFGLGLVLREGARAAGRAATKILLPGIGNAISGLVAAGGTYAIGRAASAYYIEGMSLANARLLLQREGRVDRSVFNLLDWRKAKGSRK